MLLKRLFATGLILASHMGIMPEAVTVRKQERLPVRIILPALYEKSVNPFSMYELSPQEEDSSREEKDRIELPSEEQEESEERYDTENAGVSFNPYVFTVDEPSGVTASVELQPELMVVGNEEIPDAVSGSLGEMVENPNETDNDTSEEPEAKTEESESDTAAEEAIALSVNGTFVPGNQTVIGNSTGELIPISSDTIKAELAEKDVTYRYNGQTHQPEVRVYLKDSQVNLTQEQDYSVEYGKNVDAGTGNITIFGTGQYCGERNLEFPIEKAEINDTNTVVYIYPSSYFYTGSPITPESISVYFGDTFTSLEEGKDYTVTVSDNKEIGNAKVLINGTNNYAGGVTAQFAIITDSEKEAPAIRSASVTYNQTADAVFRTQDFHSEYYELYVYTPKSITNPMGSRTIDGKTCYVVGLDSFNPGMSGVSIVNITASGVKMQEITLSSKNLYFAGNTPPVAGETVYVSVETQHGGESQPLKVTVQENGSQEKTPITDKTIAIEFHDKNINTTTVYNADRQTPEIVVYNKTSQLKLLEGVDYSLSYGENINAGKGSVTVIGIGNYEKEKTLTFKINKAKLQDNDTVIRLDKDKYIYEGSAITPEETVIFKTGTANLTLQKGTDYKVSLKNNNKVGEGTITITGLDPNFTGSVSQKFKIVDSPYTPITDKSIAIDFFDPALNKTRTTVYNGEWQTPEMLVYNKDTLEKLEEGVDYKTKYGENLNAGKGNVTIIGIGNFTKEKTVTFTIEKAKLLENSTGILLDQDSYVYTGEKIIPSETVIFNTGTKNITLVRNKDYTVSLKNNIRVGNATITITGKENFEKSVSDLFEIVEKDPVSIKEAKVDIIPRTEIYSGDSKTPKVIVIFNETVLKEGTDYTVLYDKNVNAGTALVTVIGKGSYTDNVTDTFVIEPLPADFRNMEIRFTPENMTYTGSAAEPEVTVVLKSSGTALVNGKDYDVKFYNNINAGEGTAVVSTKGNFSGNLSTVFAIVPAHLSENTTVTLTPDTFIYSGDPNEPAVEVTHNGNRLIRDTDYQVVFRNNTEVGDGKAIVRGMGNYDKNATASFRITVGSLSENTSVELAVSHYTYSGDPNTPDVKVTCNKTVLTRGKDYMVTYANNTNAGTAKVIVKGIGNYGGNNSAEFTIDPYELTESNTRISFNPENSTYTGEELEPEVIVKVVSGSQSFGDTPVSETEKTLTADVDYETDFSNNVNAGSGDVTIRGIGNYNGTIQDQFVIEPASLSENTSIVLTPDTFIYSGEANEPDTEVSHNGRTLLIGEDYTIDFNNNTEVGNGSAVVSGTGNYKNSATAMFAIKAGDLSNETTVITITPESVTYSGDVNTPNVTVVCNGNELEPGRDFTVRCENNTDAGTARVTVSGIGDYIGNNSAEFTVTPLPVNSKDVVITLDNDTVIYTGDPIEVPVTVKLRDRELTKDTDYEVFYENNTEIGNATVTVRGKGNFNATAEKTFRIREAYQYNVEFDADNGSGETMNMTAAEGQPFELPDCPFDPPFGKEFDAWDAGDPGETISVTEDRTVRALWKDLIYPVVKGGNQTVTKGKDIELTIRTGKDTADNQSVDIDGIPVPEEYVKTKNTGNETVVIIHRDYVKKIKEGKHRITVTTILGGKAETNVRVKKSGGGSGGSDDSKDSRYIPPYNPQGQGAASRNVIPNTSDNTRILFWSGSLLAGILGILLSVSILRKKSIRI